MATMQMELDWFKRWAQYSPKAVAIRCADSNRTFTYLEVYERTCALALQLQKRFSVEQGDRVAVLAGNAPETIFLFYALQRLGAILVPINFRFAPREVDHVLRDSGAKLLFFQEAYSSVVEKLLSTELVQVPFEGEEGLSELAFQSSFEIPVHLTASAEDPVMILYTSGTTGAPKGALITHQMLFWNSVNTGLRLQITNTDKTIIFHPMFHTSGWNVLTTPFFHHGAAVVLLNKFEPERVLSLCDSEGITILFGVPTMMDRMATSANFTTSLLSTVRFAIVGGEPMPVVLIRTWASKRIPARQGYGLTEFGPNVFSLNEEDAIRKIGSIGFPNFYVQLKVVDEYGTEVKEPGRVGELWLKGPVCTPGYWRNEHATAEAIRDGWFVTGDLVLFDEEGYFYVVGRKKEMFISGAENVYPAEIEQYLRSLPGVREVAVVGVPDAKWGEVGKCFYSSDSGEPVDEKLLYEYCLSGLAKYKIPKSFVHLSELPKGASGKIQRRDLPVSS